jgi:hypothetical protein
MSPGAALEIFQERFSTKLSLLTSRSCASIEKTSEIAKPNGLESSSPGLRGTSYPGSSFKTHFNPNGVAAMATTFDSTLSGLTKLVDVDPA